MTNREYSGDPIDGTVQYLGDSEPMSTRKDANGETVAATTDDDMHDMTTDHIPSEVDLEELTEKQAEIVEIAAKNPTISVRRIDERIGSNDSKYAGKVLRNECPNWYENVFKPQTKRAERKDTDSSDNSDVEPRRVRCVECGYKWSTKTDNPRCTQNGCRSRKVVNVGSSDDSEAEKATSADRVEFVQESEDTTEEPDSTAWEQLGENVTVKDSLTQQQQLRRIRETCETVAHMDTPVGEFAAGILEVIQNE